MALSESVQSFEFVRLSFVKRILLSLLSDLPILLILSLGFCVSVGFKYGLAFSMVFLSYYLIENGLWMRYYIVKILFSEKEIFLEYYYFDRKISRTILYEDLIIRKERLCYKKTSAHFYLNFIYKGKSLLKQHTLNEFNNVFMDRLQSQYQSLRFERSGSSPKEARDN